MTSNRHIFLMLISAILTDQNFIESFTLVGAGRVILEAASVTAVLVVSLTLYTFWAASRGHDFQFLGPFLFCSLVALICFGIIRVCIAFLLH